jgi:tetratricopeptide (TPR) repeat protein
MPASAMEALVHDLRQRVPKSRRLEIVALLVLADVEAMCDRFDEARRLVADADALALELGTPPMRDIPAEVELLAGDAATAERILREELEDLERIGDFGHYVSVVPPYVDALVLQGRGEEARRAVEICVRHAIEDDVDAQIGLRCSQAALLLIDGDLAEAEEQAREAVAIAGRADYVLARIRALSGLADVLASSGRSEEARDALEQAIHVAREKESVAHERILRARLAELAAQPPATT